MSMYKNLPRYLLPPKLLRSSTFDPHPPLNPLPAAPPNVSAAVGVAPVSEAPPTGSSDIKVLPSIFRKGPSPSLLGAPPLTAPSLLVASPELHHHTAPPHHFDSPQQKLNPAPSRPAAATVCNIQTLPPPFSSLCGRGGPTWGRSTVQPIRSRRPTFSSPLPHLLNAQLWRENATCVPFSFSCVCMCVRSVKNCKSDLSPPSPHPAPPPAPPSYCCWLFCLVHVTCQYSPPSPTPNSAPSPSPFAQHPPLIFKMTTLCRCCLL